jgi:hypothetical protein
VNTYAYTGNDSISHDDSLGLFRRGANVSDQDWLNIEQAEAKIRQELRKSCTCHANSGADSCIPCDLAETMSSRLDSSFVSNDANLPLGACGQGEVRGFQIWLGPAAYTNKGCNCLASVIYHELLHNVGLEHDGSSPDPVNSLEDKCIGNLCKRTAQ